MQTGIHEVHERTKVLAAFLAEHVVGDEVPYEDFVEHLHMDVRLDTYRGYLRTARTWEERHGRVWETIRGVGLVLRNDTEAVVVAEGKLRLVRNGLRRTRRTLRAIKLGRLTSEGRARWSTLHVVTSVMHALASTKGRKTIAASVDTNESVRAINKRVLDSLHRAKPRDETGQHST